MGYCFIPLVSWGNKKRLGIKEDSETVGLIRIQKEDSQMVRFELILPNSKSLHLACGGLSNQDWVHTS
jgi:hypothetical protein